MSAKLSYRTNSIRRVRALIIYSVLGIFILLALVMVMTGSFKNVSITNIFLTNQTSNSASIIWTTNKAATGKVQVSEAEDFNTLAEYFDDRDLEEIGIGQYELTSQTERQVHHVTLRGLNPEKTYYYRIINNESIEEIQNNSFKTPKVNEDIVAPDPVYGKVVNQTDGVVMMKKIAGDGSSQMVSTVISEGSYSLDGGNLLDENLANNFVSQNYIEEIQVVIPSGITKAQVENSQDQPVQDITPGQQVTLESANIQVQAEQRFYSPNPAHQDNCCYIENRSCQGDQWAKGWDECAVQGKCGCVAKTSNENPTNNNSNNANNPEPALGESAPESGDCTAAKSNPNSCKQDGVCNPLDVYAQTGGNLVDGQNCPDNQGYIERYRQDGGGCGYRFRGCVKGSANPTNNTSNNNSSNNNNTNTGSGKPCWNGTIPHGSYSCLTTTSYIKCVDGAYSQTIKGTCSVCKGTSTNLSDICQNASGPSDNTTTTPNQNNNTNNNNTNTNTTGQLKCGDVDSSAECLAQFGNGNCNVPKDGACTIKNGMSNCVYGYNCRSAKCVPDGKICTADSSTSSGEPVSNSNGDGVPAGYKNIAPDAQIVSSYGTIDAAKNPVKNSIDQNPTNYWYNETNHPNGTTYITLQWNGNQKISKIRVKNAWDKKFAPKLTLQVASRLDVKKKEVDNNDGTLWDDIDFNYETNAITIQYVKGNSTSTSEWGGWGFIYEIQVLVADGTQQPAQTGSCNKIEICDNSEHLIVDLKTGETKDYSCANGTRYKYTCSTAGTNPTLVETSQNTVAQESLTISGPASNVISQVSFKLSTLNLYVCPKEDQNKTPITVSTAQTYPSAIIKNISADGKWFNIKVDNKSGWVLATTFKETAEQLASLSRSQTTPADQCISPYGIVQVSIGFIDGGSTAIHNGNPLSVSISNGDAVNAGIIASKMVNAEVEANKLRAGDLTVFDGTFKVEVTGNALEGMVNDAFTNPTANNAIKVLQTGDFSVICAFKVGTNEILTVNYQSNSYYIRNILLNSIFNSLSQSKACPGAIQTAFGTMVVNYESTFINFYAYDKTVTLPSNNAENGNVSVTSESGLLDPGSYKVEGTNVTTKEFTISEPGKIVYFQDLNGDGIKQENEPLYDGDVASLNVQFNKISEVQSYNMTTGWNLVSFPIYMRGEGTSKITKASELISQLNAGGVNSTHIVAFRAGKFLTYSFRKDDKGNNVTFGEDFSIMPGEGYFIRTYAPGIFIVSGKKIENAQQIQVDNGWNLVGIYNSNKLSYKGFEVLNQMNGAGIEADILSKWENGLYQNVVVQSEKQYGNDYSVYPYQGYFVRVKNRGVGTYSPQ